MTDAEKGIIGCVLVDSGCLYSIYEKLKPEMFSDEFSRDCYNEMLVMYDLGEKINPVLLSQRLESRRWDRNDISSFLSECVSQCPTSAYAKNYSDSIIRDFKSRTVKKLFESVSIMPKDIDNTISEVISRFEELQTNQHVKSKSLKQIVKENKDNYFKDIDKHLIKTGFDKLDECLGGLEGGDVTAIGARPAVGKSAFVTQIIGQMASQGYRIGYFNLEMNESQVYERFVARMAELSLTRVRRAKAFLGGEKDKFEKANDEMSDYDVIISTGSKSIGEVRAESRHQNYDVIIVDYLQLITSEKHYGNRVSEVGEISKAMKSLASELHVPVIVLSQLSRAVEQRETKEPTMADFRESGDIEQDASNVILLWNLSETNDSIKGEKIGKCRMGVCTKIGLKFDGDHMKFMERQEDFSETLEFAKKCDKGAQMDDFASTEVPFGNWGG